MAFEIFTEANTGERNDRPANRISEFSVEHWRVKRPDDSLSRAMNGRTDNDKLNLSIDELVQVKTIEGAILAKSSSGIQSALRGLKDASADMVMETVLRDLRAIGVHGSWNSKERELQIAADMADGTFTSVCFDTQGRAKGINMPIPTADGSASVHNPRSVGASDALAEILRIAKPLRLSD